MPKAAPDLNIEVEEYKGFTVPDSIFCISWLCVPLLDFCVSGSQFASVALEIVTYQSLDISSLLIGA